jgi:hypothetical protein
MLLVHIDELARYRLASFDDTWDIELDDASMRSDAIAFGAAAQSPCSAGTKWCAAGTEIADGGAAV